MARKIGGKPLSFSVDLSGVINALAAGQALAFSVKDKPYMKAVVDAALSEADDVFNVEAAAYASTTGKIKHMYEWGTIGVNNGRTNRRQQPTSPQARLWETFAIGGPTNRTLTFSFKPSVANVPKPTSRDTGMSQEVISKMRDHRFTYKARVMEEGQTVEIAPKRKYLLIPAYKHNRSWMRPHDIKRGYTLLQHPITASPGHNTLSGNFSIFWTKFWESTGQRIVDETVEKQMLGDFTPYFSAVSRARDMKPAYLSSIQGAVNQRAKKINAQARRNAKARTRGL